MIQPLPADTFDSTNASSAPVPLPGMATNDVRRAHSDSNHNDLEFDGEIGKHRDSTFRRGISWFVSAAAWCGVLALAVLSLLRILFHDGTNLLTCINAFTFYVYLPAYVVLAWATWGRRWALCAVSGFVVLCHVVWVAPDFTPARTLRTSPAVTAVPPTVKIFYANISAFNAQPAGILKEIESEDPDVVVLVEYWRPWQELVMKSTFIQKYRYGTGITERYLGEIGVLSKLPITIVERRWPTGRQICILDLQIGTETVRLFCLHSPRPMNITGHEYVDYWTETLPLIGKQPEPLIVLGDFNATQHSKVFHDLTSRALRSAHVDRGRGYAVSWPNGKFAAPPIRIDQALLSPEVECLGIREGQGQGSDHKPLIFEIRVHREPSSAGSPIGRG